MTGEVLGGEVRKRLPGGIATALGNAIGHEGVIGAVNRGAGGQVGNRSVCRPEQDAADGGEGYAECECGPQAGRGPVEGQGEAVEPAWAWHGPPRQGQPLGEGRIEIRRGLLDRQDLECPAQGL